MPTKTHQLDHLMTHGEKPPLDGRVSEKRKQSRDRHEQCHEPKGRGRSTCFDENHERGRRYGGAHSSVPQEE